MERIFVFEAACGGYRKYCCANSGRPNGIIFHTDRGLKYTSKESGKRLDEVKIGLFKYNFGFCGSTRPYSNNGGLFPNYFEYL